MPIGTTVEMELSSISTVAAVGIRGGALYQKLYTGCNRRNGPHFGRVFLMLNYTEKPQNTYIQISTVTEI